MKIWTQASIVWERGDLTRWLPYVPTMSNT